MRLTRGWRKPISFYACYLLIAEKAVLQATGVAFPEVTTFWQGEKFRCLGAGNRKKKIAFVGVKVNS